LQRHFEAGRFQQVVDTPVSDSSPDAIYMAAQSFQKLGANEQALQTYDRLAARPDTDVWHFVGLSGRQLLEGQIDLAIATARQATMVAPQDAAAHFQLGLALARQQNWPEAAAAFEAAIERQPMFAYAHYYGGLAQYRANRPDRMAILFDQFLRLAPEAPERPEVLSIMRTIRR
jgi:tetratricopeptide (TPR) repeat protein